MKTTQVNFDLSRFGGIGPLAGSERQNVTVQEQSGPSGPSGPSKNPLFILENEKGNESAREKTIRSARTTRTTGTNHPLPRSPTFRFSTSMEFGDVCYGWTPESWMGELRRKADRCDGFRSDIAKYYRDWANDIERRLRERSPQN